MGVLGTLQQRCVQWFHLSLCHPRVTRMEQTIRQNFKGRKFMGEFPRMLKEDYSQRKRPITARNPQANAILERVDQTLGQMLRTYELQDLEDLTNPLDGILAAISFALRATTHTTLQASPTQLAVGRDHILNVKFEVDWQKICKRKQEMINKTIKEKKQQNPI